MSFSAMVALMGGILAIVMVGVALGLLILSDRTSGGLAALQIEPRTAWRLRAMHFLAAAAMLLLAGFAIACARF